MSIRNFDSTQTNHSKNLSFPFARKSNLKIVNILGREILNSGSGLKPLSKRHRPKTGRAARWELSELLMIRLTLSWINLNLGESVFIKYFYHYNIL